MILHSNSFWRQSAQRGPKLKPCSMLHVGPPKGGAQNSVESIHPADLRGQELKNLAASVATHARRVLEIHRCNDRLGCSVAKKRRAAEIVLFRLLSGPLCLAILQSVVIARLRDSHVVLCWFHRGNSFLLGSRAVSSRTKPSSLMSGLWGRAQRVKHVGSGGLASGVRGKQLAGRGSVSDL